MSGQKVIFTETLIFNINHFLKVLTVKINGRKQHFDHIFGHNQVRDEDKKFNNVCQGF